MVVQKFNLHTQNTLEDELESGHRIDVDVSASVLVSRPNKKINFFAAFAIPGLITALVAVSVQAQKIEPRAYSNAPVGVDFLMAITTSLTIGALSGKVRDPQDLSSVRVGSVAHSLAHNYLTKK